MRSGESTQITRDEAEREVAGLRAPRPRRRRAPRAAPPARLDRPARREPLPAVAVIRADARRTGRASRSCGIAHVADLGMQQPVQELAAGHPAAADAGADRDVAEGVEPPGRAPAVLAERGRVDVGVEGDRHRQAPADLLADVGVRPAGLGGRGDVSPGRRRRVCGRSGPNEPIPIASTGPSRSKNAITGSIVSSGVVVGIVSVARRSSGPVADRALPLGAACLDPAVDGHAAPRRTTRGRRTRPGGRRRAARSGPRPSIRSSSSCVPSVPNVSAGCSMTVRNGYRREAYSMSSKQTSAMSSGTSRPRAAHRLDRADRDEVVDREDGGRPILQLEQPPHPLEAAARVDRRRSRPAPGRAGARQRRARPRTPGAGRARSRPRRTR